MTTVKHLHYTKVSHFVVVLKTVQALAPGSIFFLSLCDSVTAVLNKATGITNDRKVIKLMISEMSQSTFPQELCYRFLQRNIAKEIYKCEAPAFIDKAIRSEIHMFKEILSQTDK